MSPMQLSLRYLRNLGYTVWKTEHWNSFSRSKTDLFGGIDIAGIKSGENGVLGVQTTTTGHMNDRKEKLNNLPAILLWASVGNPLEVHGWSKKGPRGKRKLWTLTRQRWDGKDWQDIT